MKNFSKEYKMKCFCYRFFTEKIVRIDEEEM